MTQEKYRLDLEPIRKRVDRLSYHWLPELGERAKHEINMHGHTLTSAHGKILGYIAQGGDAEFFRNARVDIVSLLSELVYFRSRTAKAEPLLHIMEGQPAITEEKLSQIASSEVSVLMGVAERFLIACNAELERRGQLASPAKEDPS